MAVLESAVASLDLGVQRLTNWIETEVPRAELRWPSLYDSVLELVVDASLQAGMKYSTVVYPRVCRARERWPEAWSLCAALDVVEENGIEEVLDWRGGAKCQTALGLLGFFFARRLGTVGAIREWMLSGVRRTELEAIKGVGPKTTSYIAKLVGVDCIAVDRHVQRSVGAIMGVSVSQHQAADFLKNACRSCNVPCLYVDSMIWASASGKI